MTARPLCQLHGHPEEDKFDGVPLWKTYLDEVDTVLQAVGWKPEPDGLLVKENVVSNGDSYRLKYPLVTAERLPWPRWRKKQTTAELVNT